MGKEHVRVEMHGLVALVTLARPPVNALNRKMRYEIVEIFDEKCLELAFGFLKKRSCGCDLLLQEPLCRRNDPLAS